MKTYCNENKFYNHLEERIGAVLLAIMAMMLFIQTVMRYIFKASAAWISEYSLYMFVYLVFPACSGTFFGNDHIQIMTITDKLPGKVREAVYLFPYVVNFLFVTVVGYYVFLRVVDQSQVKTVSVTRFPLWIMSVSFFVRVGVSAVRYSMNTYFIIRYEFINGREREWMADMILVGSLFVLVFMGFFMATVLGPACCLYSNLFGTIDMSLIVESLLNGTNSFTLLAIPSFILSGELMIEGGISQRLISLCMSLVKDRPGGLAIVTAIANMFFAAVSGSGLATVACTGGIMTPRMIRTGYSKEFSTAVAAAGGALGSIIPPSILFLLYGVATSISVAKLFPAGAFPGILLGIATIIIAKKISIKGEYVPGPKIKVKLREVYDVELWYNSKEVIQTLLVPVIVLGGIYSGVFSPTEASIVTCVYALSAGTFIYKDLKLTNLPGVFARAAKGHSFIVIISFSTTFVKLLILEGVTSSIANGILDMTTNRYFISILINVLLLVMGMIMDAVPTTTISGPILLKIVQPLGVDPIQLGVIIVMSLPIGVTTPSVGTNLLVGCKISKVQLESTLKFTLQLLIYMLVVLALTTYIPTMSFFLPQILTQSSAMLLMSAEKFAV